MSLEVVEVLVGVGDRLGLVVLPGLSLGLLVGLGLRLLVGLGGDGGARLGGSGSHGGRVGALVLLLVLVVDSGVLTVGTVIVVVRVVHVVVVVVVVVEGWGRDGDAGADGLESALAGAVFDLTTLTVAVDVAVLAVNFAGRVLGLDLEASVGPLVTVAVRAVVVVTVDLLQDGHWGGAWQLLGAAQGHKGAGEYLRTRKERA